MKCLFNLSLLLLCAGLLPAGEVRAQPREEFNGPLAGWADVKAGFGAKGNGKEDDTRAIQRAIDGLANPVTGFRMGAGAYAVVYLPAGTYCISSTLLLKGKIGISIIGEDPARTIIRWTGRDQDTMLWANGSAYFRIGRIGWDANGRKEMEGIGIHWKDIWNDGQTRSFATLNIEISDCFFTGKFKYGISGGTYGGGNGTGANDSEITIRRCCFRDCTASGIEIGGYNALDYWIWDCRFLRCSTGINCTNGNYHVYRSFFLASAASDVHNTNGYYTSVRGCYSFGSNKLSWEAGSSSNPFKRIFQDNTVINLLTIPVVYTHLGKITLWGNRFSRQRDSSYKFSVLYGSWALGNYEILSLHNIYTLAQPFLINVKSYHTVYAFGDEIRPGAVLKSDSQAFFRTMDPTPRLVHRQILEVPAGAGSDQIQSILDRAAALKGSRPLVHFGLGTYYLDRPLEIPAGSDMQLAGDGLLYVTVIRKRNPALFPRGPLLLVHGPGKISIRDLQIGAEGDRGQTGILFENADQPGSEAHLDQVYAHADTSLFVGGMDHLYVQKENSFFTSGNYISGGRLVQEGKGEAMVSCYGGQFARLTVDRGARFLAKDCWWEGAERIPLDLQGSGTVSIDGAMIAPNGVDSTPTIRIGKFSGNISLMDMYLQGALWVRPDNPALKLLVWNVHFYYKMDPLAFLKEGHSYTGAFLGLNSQCFRANDPACKDIFSPEDRVENVRDLPAFLDSQTAPARESRPRIFRELAPGASNIYLSRVSLGTMDKGIVFAAGGREL